MKHVIFILAAAILAMGSLGCSFDKSEEYEFPRFQILDEGNMKFDTQTGKTWVRQGSQWLLMTEAESEKEKSSTHEALSTCEYIVNMDVRLEDLRKSDAFAQLSDKAKMRVFQTYYTHHKLWRDEMADSRKLRDLQRAVREELAID